MANVAEGIFQEKLKIAQEQKKEIAKESGFFAQLKKTRENFAQRRQTQYTTVENIATKTTGGESTKRKQPGLLGVKGWIGTAYTGGGSAKTQETILGGTKVINQGGIFRTSGMEKFNTKSSEDIGQKITKKKVVGTPVGGGQTAWMQGQMYQAPGVMNGQLGSVSLADKKVRPRAKY